MLLINTSVKEDNNTGRVISSVSNYFRDHDQPCAVAKMVSFTAFTHDYITDMTDLSRQAIALIQQLQSTSDHVYFVPTYYKSMPGVFKNYLDIVRIASLYQYKRIGIVSTNAKNQDYGARHFMQSLLGLLEFHRATSVIIPQVLVLNPEKVDHQAFQIYRDYFTSFPVPTA